MLSEGSMRGTATKKRIVPKTASVHNYRELIAAHRAGVDLIFLSPVFPTRSHPGGPTLGRRRFAELALRARVPVIALGGITAHRARSLKGAYGWAGIDAWLKPLKPLQTAGAPAARTAHLAPPVHRACLVPQSAPHPSR